MPKAAESFYLNIARFIGIFVWFYVEKANNESLTQSENKTKYPGDEKILAEILEQNETVNSQDTQGYTALHRASRQGNESYFQTIEIQKENLSNYFMFH